MNELEDIHESLKVSSCIRRIYFDNDAEAIKFSLEDDSILSVAIGTNYDCCNEFDSYWIELEHSAGYGENILYETDLG